MNEQKNEQELRLEDCVAMKRGWLLMLFLLLAGNVLAFFLASLSVAILLSLSMFGREVFGWDGVDVEKLKQYHSGISIAIGMLWLAIVLLGLNFGGGGLFVAYWRRNVVGYTQMFWLVGDEVKSLIFYGKRAGGPPKNYYLLLPLGGWFRQPTLGIETYKKWWLQRVCPYHDLWDGPVVYLHDGFGSRLLLRPAEALEIAVEGSNLFDFWRKGLDNLTLANTKLTTACNNLSAREMQLNAMIELVLNIAETICRTSRLQYSIEGRVALGLLVRGFSAVFNRADPRMFRLETIVGDQFDEMLSDQPVVKSRRVKRSKKVAVVEETPATEAATTQQ